MTILPLDCVATPRQGSMSIPSTPEPWRRLPRRQYARYQESWRTKIIYAGDSQLTALFAESGLSGANPGNNRDLSSYLT